MKPYKIVILLLLHSAIVGCGQPGPLYLPNQAAPVHVEPVPAQKPEPKPD
ncbi:lipoprotein [Methylobacter sp. G7]